MYVGIDAGGSGTRAALADGGGAVLATGFAGPSNGLSGEPGRQRLREALDGALAPLVLVVGEQPVRVCAGVRGLSDPGREPVVRQAVARLWPTAELTLETDARIAVWGALAGSEGVAVLAGTGSIAYARASDGREARAGGFGYLLGDEGSAFWLGRAAVAHVLRAAEGRAEATALSQALPPLSELMAWVYSAPAPVERLASLAPLVADAAARGDAAAQELLRIAAKDLARLARAAVRGVWPAGSPPELPVACCGGVWRAGRVLMQPFTRALGAEVPMSRVVEPRMPPTGGAILLAMGAVDATVVGRLAAELG